MSLKREFNLVCFDEKVRFLFYFIWISFIIFVWFFYSNYFALGIVSFTGFDSVNLSFSSWSSFRISQTPMGEQGREELRRQDCVRRGGGEQACGRVRRAGARGRAVNAGEEGEGEEHPTTD